MSSSDKPEISSADRAAVKTDDGSPEYIPTAKDLLGLKYKSTTTSIATPEQVAEVYSIWQNQMKVPKHLCNKAAWDLCRHLADVGSSKQSTPVGISPISTSTVGISRLDLAAAVKTVIPLRRFARYFARVVWQMMEVTKNPPAQWQKMEFREEDRFAAFDFFDAVLSPASLQIPIAREPSDNESIAFATRKGIVTERKRVQDGNARTRALEVTAGRAGGLSRAPVMPDPSHFDG
uniref:CP n=1 Tax=Dioscorea potexvirus 1 TaxID=2794413 RepID=A0A7T5QZ89_9VIRU|nr:CP [Dioscorea potexvirus 1]